MNKWQEFKYTLPNKLVSPYHIQTAISNFAESILSKLSDSHYLLIIFKIRTEDNLLRSISVVQKVNKLQLDNLIEVFIEYWQLKIDNYHQFDIKEIIFNYLIIDNEQKISKPKLNRPKPVVIMQNLLQVGGYNFPATMDRS